MQQDTPLKKFEAKIGDFEIRLNLMTEQASDISHFNEGLSIYAVNYVQKYCFEEFYNLENIPKEAKTIFFDLQTFFAYIVENHLDDNKFKINNNGMIVSNIIKARGIQRRQQVFLQMSKKPYIVIDKNEKIIQNPQIHEIVNQNKKLKMEIHDIKQNYQILKKQNKIIINSINNIQQKLIKNNIQNDNKINQYEKNILTLIQQQQISKQFINTTKNQMRYLIQSINQLKRDLSIQKSEKQQLKQQIRQLRNTIKQIKTNNHSSINLSNTLGQKIQISIDKSNPHISKYTIQDDVLQKIDGDQTRYQILCNQILGKYNKSYFQVKIINLVNNGLIIGIVSNTRKGQRHSYDQKQCICYDGTGKIFEIGRKWPVPVKLQAGHIIRVMIDLEQSLIRWYISFTEIGSAVIPDYLKKSKIVPYIQLNEVSDKISLNK